VLKLEEMKRNARSKDFCFKVFGQVTSRYHVVQEEMKKNAFFYYFQELKLSILKPLDRSGQDIRWFKKK
jgi:hypothetical protein